jgi:sulfoxide reductase heme-binding subunit YedZ
MDSSIPSGAFWYASRATGVVSLLLLTAVVLMGVLVTSGGRLPGLPRFAVTDLHRNLSLLAVAFLAVHVVSVVSDSYVTIGWSQVVIPWGGSYRPLWVGLGTVSFDLLLALVASSLIRVRLGLRMWRAIHWLAYAAWPVAVVHGLGAGTDLSSGWMLALTVSLVAAVLSAAAWRIGRFVDDVPRAQRVSRRLVPRPPGPATTPGESAGDGRPGAVDAHANPGGRL